MGLIEKKAGLVTTLLAVTLSACTSASASSLLGVPTGSVGLQDWLSASVPRLRLASQTLPVPSWVEDVTLRVYMPCAGDEGCYHRATGVQTAGGCVVTAAHVLGDGDPEAINQRADGVRFGHYVDKPKAYGRPDGGHWDRDRDLSFMCMGSRLSHVGIVNVAASTPKKGDRVEALLMASSGGPEYIEAEVGPEDKWGNYFLIGGVAQSGDSGGPVFNSRGELVGVITGGPRPSDASLTVPFELLWKTNDMFTLHGLTPVTEMVDGDFIVVAKVSPNSIPNCP